MDETERLAHIQLWLAEGIGPERRAALLDRFHSAAAIFQSNPTALQSVPGISKVIAERLFDPSLVARAQAEWDRMCAMNVRWLGIDDKDYPAVLREIPRPAVALTVLGELHSSEPSVAIVGSRKCTPYGRQFAGRLATDLARAGVTVVSGLARGIDAVAHEAALEAGGRTIAVLASGLANIYPPEHKDLAAAIVNQGALVSEAPLDGPPVGNLFPLRNRIISGLSLGVIIVEATSKSGAMSTAYHALDQNREVFAVPGRLDDPNSEGTLDLIRRGAALIRSAKDVLDQIGPISQAQMPVAEKNFERAPPPTTKSVTMPPGLSEDEAKIWNALGVDGLDADSLAEKTGIPTPKLSGMLLMLELRRVVQRKPGNRFGRG